MARISSDVGRNALFTCRINKTGEVRIVIDYDDGRVASVLLSDNERQELIDVLKDHQPNRTNGLEFPINR